MRRFALPPSTAAILAAASLSTLAIACTTYQDDLARGQKAFEQLEYERTLAIFRELEPEASQLSVDDQARYAYLRGMTDYRIGYRADARHWLSLAKSIDGALPQALPLDWKKRMKDALAEMNESVYATGYESLTNTETGAKPEAPGASARPRPSDDAPLATSPSGNANVDASASPGPRDSADAG